MPTTLTTLYPPARAPSPAKFRREHRLLCFLILLLARTACCAAQTTPVPEVVAKGFGFVEGTIFVGPDLFFVDYTSSRVLRLHDGQVQVVWSRPGCGANGLADLQGTLLVACYDNGSVEVITQEGRQLSRIDRDLASRGFVAPNDFALDARGGVYFTASGSGDDPPGRVLYRHADGVVSAVADGVSDANGLVVSWDGKTLYLASSGDDELFTYAIAVDGSLSDKRSFARLDRLLADDGAPRHMPDGVRMDRHGNIFIGLYEGNGFAVLDAGGAVIARVKLPGAHNANLAISPDGASVYATAVTENQDGTVDGEIVRVPNPVP